MVLSTVAMLTLACTACESVESPVDPSTMVELRIIPDSIVLAPGVSREVKVENGNGDAAANDHVSWSTSAPGVVKVEPNGSGAKVIAVSTGSAQITATLNGKSASSSITVASHPPPSGMIPAFPGAEGWGATALNECRDLPLVVHQVTNTDDDGPGSLRDILKNRIRGDRFDVVVFRTGGLIRLRSELESRRGHCLYIAGQTAPGGGISLVGHRLRFRTSNDVVLRHIRHRGQNPGTAIHHRGGSRVVYDHITGSWSVGRFIVRFESTNGNPLSDITIQNSLLYEPDRSHATILGLVGHPKPDPEARRMSAHRNALLGPGRRMPKCSAYEVSVANNVIYNWQQRGAASANTSSCDFVANYLKPGPTTLSGSSRFSRRPFVVHDSCVDGDPGECTSTFYVAENRNHVNGYQAGSNDPWSDPDREVTCMESGTSVWCEDDGPVPFEFRRSAPLPAADVAVTVEPISDDLVEQIVAQAGHSRKLTCEGSWTSVRDAADAERIHWFRTGSGFGQRIYAEDMQVPVPSAGEPCPDTDRDGIPDAWEERYFGCPTCANPTAVGAGGYLVIEHYVNGTDPR